MRALANRRGFSLVELLTVIAIIAILAAIIFPIMTSVKDKAKVTSCMTNMQNIQQAITIYKTDNRRFPDTLGIEFQADVPFDLAKPLPGALTIFRDRNTPPAAFRCPSSPALNYSDKLTVNYPVPLANGATSRELYAVDSYDAQYLNAPGGDVVEAHYVLRWAADPAAVAGFAPHPPGTADTTTLQEDDYERQLCMRTPPGDTVVTWCGYHKGNMTLVLFLDGHVDRFPSGEVQASKWRTRSKRL
jgi:prepilin-type N-terminal cleavage/methylation domain-containing protein/prepilin-type processing-associated H-X9-DG protein